MPTIHSAVVEYINQRNQGPSTPSSTSRSSNSFSQKLSGLTLPSPVARLRRVLSLQAPSPRRVFAKASRKLSSSTLLEKGAFSPRASGAFSPKESGTFPPKAILEERGSSSKDSPKAPVMEEFYSSPAMEKRRPLESFTFDESGPRLFPLATSPKNTNETRGKIEEYQSRLKDAEAKFQSTNENSPRQPKHDVHRDSISEISEEDPIFHRLRFVRSGAAKLSPADAQVCL